MEPIYCCYKDRLRDLKFMIDKNDELTQYERLTTHAGVPSRIKNVTHFKMGQLQKIFLSQ